MAQTLYLWSLVFLSRVVSILGPLMKLLIVSFIAFAMGLQASSSWSEVPARLVDKAQQGKAKVRKEPRPKERLIALPKQIPQIPNGQKQTPTIPTNRVEPTSQWKHTPQESPYQKRRHDQEGDETADTPYSRYRPLAMMCFVEDSDGCPLAVQTAPNTKCWCETVDGKRMAGTAH